MKNDSLILSMQRKVIGGYINAEQFATCADTGKILEFNLSEELFSNVFHKAVVRAINILKSQAVAISDLTVLAFLQSKGMPRTIEQENEYNYLQSEFAITYSTFMTYINALRKNSHRGVTL